MALASDEVVEDNFKSIDATIETVTETKDENTSRDRWSSRWSFIFAAVGSAVGIGNIWRFPTLAYAFEGATFFIPYIFAMVFMGIPMLTLELALGQCYQGAHVQAFGRINKRFRGVGLGACLLAFLTVCYYSVLLAWSLRYIIECFQTNLPWAAPEGLCNFVDEATCISHNSGSCVWDTTLNKCSTNGAEYASNFFKDNVINIDPDGSSLQLVGSLVGLLAFIWVLIYFTIRHGVNSTGFVMYFTLTLPMVLLLLVMIVGLTLEGSSIGLYAFLGKWDLSLLWKRPDIWNRAAGQIFFSLGVTYGQMTAYASYNNKHQNVTQDSVIVSVINSLSSVVAGIAVFTVAGYLANSLGVTDESGLIKLDSLSAGGPSLVFSMYPVALSTLPGAQFFSVCFFLAFFFLGLDSAVALATAFTSLWLDARVTQKEYHVKSRRFKISQSSIVIICIVIAFLLGLPYCSRIGYYLFDTADFYLSAIASIFLGFSEAFAAGWVYASGRQRSVCGTAPVLIHCATWFLGINLGAVLCIFNYASIAWSFGIGISIVVIGFVTSLLLVPDYDSVNEVSLNFKQRLWWLGMGNVSLLRDELNELAQLKGFWRIGNGWCFLMRYFLPALFSIFFIQTFGPNADFPTFHGHPIQFQVYSIGISFLIIFFCVVGYAFPDFYLPITPCKDSETKISDVELPAPGSVIE